MYLSACSSDGPGVRAETGADTDPAVSGVSQQTASHCQSHGVAGQIARQLTAQRALRRPLHPRPGRRTLAHQLQQCPGQYRTDKIPVPKLQFCLGVLVENLSPNKDCASGKFLAKCEQFDQFRKLFRFQCCGVGGVVL